MRFRSAPRLLDHVDSKRVFFGLVIANLVGLLLALMLLVFLQRADGSQFIGYVADSPASHLIALATLPACAVLPWAITAYIGSRAAAPFDGKRRNDPR
jgi:hypothetical protein